MKHDETIATIAERLKQIDAKNKAHAKDILGEGFEISALPVDYTKRAQDLLDAAIVELAAKKVLNDLYGPIHTGCEAPKQRGAAPPPYAPTR